MKQIDRLILKARRSTGTELHLAMIDHHGDSWTATAHLWGRGGMRSPDIRESQHDTLDAAIDHIHALAAQYPNSRDLVILVDDV